MQSKQTFTQRLQVRESAPGWSLGLAAIFLVAYFVLWIAGQVVAVTLSNDNPSSPVASTLAIGTLIGLLAVSIGVVLWVRRILGKTWLEELHAGRVRTSYFVYLLIGLGAAWAIDLVGIITQLNGGQVVPGILSPLREQFSAAWVVAAVLAVIVQPLADTLVFPGLLYPVLAHGFNNNIRAIIGTAVVYAVLALGLGAGTGAWYAVIQPLLMMLVITGIRAYTQSLRPTLAARIMFGLFFILSALVLKA